MSRLHILTRPAPWRRIRGALLILHGCTVPKPLVFAVSLRRHGLRLRTRIRPDLHGAGR